MNGVTEDPRVPQKADGAARNIDRMTGKCVHNMEMI